MGKKQRQGLAILLAVVLLGQAAMPMSRQAEAATETGNRVTFYSESNELEISLREVKDNDYWYEYYISVVSHSAQSICDWSIELTCSDSTAFSKGFECVAKANETTGTVTVSGSGNNKVISAGETISSQEGFKLGFSRAVTFSNAKITFAYGTQSSVEDGANGVGYGNTYLEGYECSYALSGQPKTVEFKDTPVGKHGKLHVTGTQLMDAHNEPVILRGASTHGLQWETMRPFVNKAAFQNLRDEWGVNMIRLASYVTQGGYLEGKKAEMDTCIQQGVSYARELGMYAIIDWHIHNENPNDTKPQAIEFFDTYSRMYASYDNVIYEICNEPTNTPWSQIRPYAQTIVDTIRANDEDAIIVVGTNTWSQDVDEVATSGGKIEDDNVMYTIHFYSGTHSQGLRDKVTTALNAGTPIFCTEFGICDASGNGVFDVEEANRWIDFFEEKGISYSCWSLCNKDESASMISPQCSKVSGWVNQDLGATGAWLINTYRSKGGDIPDVTESPKPSGEPGVTSSPQPGEEPGVTSSPQPGEEPGVTPSPLPSGEPGVTSSPLPSGEPGVTSSPQPGEEPGVTPSAAPLVSSKPGTTGAPLVSSKPADTKHDGSVSQGDAEQLAQVTADTLPGGVLSVAEREKHSQILTIESKVSFSGKKLVVKWPKIKAAAGYEIYVSKRGSSVPKKPLKVVGADKRSLSIQKISGKKLNLSAVYEVRVKACYQSVTSGKYVAEGAALYVAGPKNKKYTNVKKIKIAKKLTLKKGKKRTVKAKLVLQKKKRNLLPLRYFSSNQSVITVSNKGKIQAKKKGSADVYLVAANGNRARIRVKVSK